MALLTGCHSLPPPARIEGVFWQPDHATVHPHGRWDTLGVDTLVVQWSQVGEHGFLYGCGSPSPTGDMPDWPRIAREPWARQVILGLASEHAEPQARAQLERLAERARCVIDNPPPVPLAGWYFPVEADPSWRDAAALATVLQRLPRPLWISVYDNGNVGGKALADWLRGWLPPDVGVLFQDGVGLYTRAPSTARAYMQELHRALGRDRVRLVAEAFRPAPGGGFRAATPEELAEQLRTYSGERVYLFEGPHYLDDARVDALRHLLQQPPR